MVYCGKCGAQIGDGAQFCPACGAPAEQVNTNQAAAAGAAAGTATTANDFTAKLQGLNNTADTTANYADADIQQNKAMAILAYFGLLVLIPILAAKESAFARYHSNQGLILFIGELIFGVAYGILSWVILAISWRLYFLVTIIGLLWIGFAVLAIIGIINAASGKAKALPLVGKFKLIK